MRQQHSALSAQHSAMCALHLPREADYCRLRVGHDGKCEGVRRQDVVRLAGLEPATPSLEGSCSGPTELQARELYFTSAGDSFCAALAHGGLAITAFCRGWLSLAARVCVVILEGLAELDRQFEPKTDLPGEQRAHMWEVQK
jgi:hypothetical protein